ncbi:MAG TPA: hypothetical protein QF556_10530, partial [Rhodospirillales bacterium]|nr:hypothetical protein [Rhodospirillales bacterium]
NLRLAKHADDLFWFVTSAHSFLHIKKVRMRQNLLIKPGPLFGGHARFGDGNLNALFESMELDQIRRGVVDAE